VSARWRLLLDGPGAGFWNMAVDEALLRSAQRGAAPTLRFYGWDGAWLSLGFAQRLDAARRAECREAGVGIVRRATGGRAVLHGADLTYAVAAPVTALPAGLDATYALIGCALRQALTRLGVPAEPAAAIPLAPGAGGFDCFQSAAAHEICAKGRKLAGSAQRRAGGGVLQHGSLRLGPDPLPARAAAGLLQESATSLAELGFALGPERVLAACMAAFESVLAANLVEGTLDEVELAQARELAGRHARPDFSLPSGISREPVAGR
jgi:lipoyl(octanoyl) transferase